MMKETFIFAHRRKDPWNQRMPDCFPLLYMAWLTQTPNGKPIQLSNDIDLGLTQSQYITQLFYKKYDSKLLLTVAIVFEYL